MAFDVSTSIPIKETDDGQVTTQQFDITTSRPVQSVGNNVTPYEEFLKTGFDESIKKSVMTEFSEEEFGKIENLTPDDYLNLSKETRELGLPEDLKQKQRESSEAVLGAFGPGGERFVSALLPFTEQSMGFFTKPFGKKPLGDTEGELKLAKEKHPVAYTLGEIAGGMAPFIITAPLFPQSLLGTTALFATIGGVSEKGRQETEESLMTPEGEKIKMLEQEIGKSAILGPIWYYSGGLSFIGRPYISALARAGIRGTGSATLAKVFGADLEEALKTGGMITALSLIFESPALMKTALGRGIIKQANRVAAESGMKSKVVINEATLDAAVARRSLLQLVKDFYKAVRFKGRVKGTPLPQEKYMSPQGTVNIVPQIDVGKPAGEGNLIEQAKQYKTVEEFVASKPIAYHGTNKEFSEFKIEAGEVSPYKREAVGPHFGTKEQAEFVSRAKSGKVKEYVLDIKNPLRLEDRNSWSHSGVLSQLFEKGLISREQYEKLVYQMESYDVRELIKELGYDSIVYNNTAEGKGDSFIIFSNDQIKTKSQLTDIWNKAQGLSPKEGGGISVGQTPISKIDTEFSGDYSTESSVRGIMEKIRKGEQVPPILISENGYLQDGRHRLEAYKRLGYKEVPTIVGVDPSVSALRDSKTGKEIPLELKEYMGQKYKSKLSPAVLPSVVSEYVRPGDEKLPAAKQKEISDELHKFTTLNGKSLILEAAGVDGSVEVSEGAYKGSVNPNISIKVDTSKAKTPEEAKAMIDKAASLYGYVLSQESVIYTNTVDINQPGNAAAGVIFEKDISTEELKALAGALNAKGIEGFSRVSGNTISVVNTNEDLTEDVFYDTLIGELEKYSINSKVSRHHDTGEYIEGEKDGQGYSNRHATSGAEKILWDNLRSEVTQKRAEVLKLKPTQEVTLLDKHISKGKTYEEVKADIENGKYIDPDILKLHPDLASDQYIKVSQEQLKEALSIHQDGRDAQEEFDKFLDKTIASVEGVEGTPSKKKIRQNIAKSVTSTALKVARQIRDGKTGYTVMDITDHVRGALLINSKETIPELLDALKASPYDWIMEIRMEYPHKSGYRGVFLKARLENGLGVELQIHTPESWALKSKTDTDFREWRVLDYGLLSEQGKIKFNDLKENTKKLYSEVFESAKMGSVKDLGSFIRKAAVSSGISIDSKTDPQEIEAFTKRLREGEKASLDSLSSKPDSVTENLAITSFPFTSNVSQKGSKVKLSLEQRQEKVESLKVELESSKPVTEFLKGRLKPGKWEGTTIPAILTTTKKGALALDEALAEVNDQGIANIANESALLETVAREKTQTKLLKDQIEELKPKMITKSEITLLKDKIKNIQTGFRKGKIAAKKEMKLVQDSVISMYKNAGLPISASVKNIQTEKQFDKAFPEIMSTINRLLENQAKRALTESIRKNTRASVIKNLRPEYKSKVLDIIDSIDLKNKSNQSIAKLNSLAEFLQNEPDNLVPAAKLQELKALGQKKLKDLTLEEMQLVDSSIKHLIKLNELKDKLIIKGKIREFKEVRSKAIGNIEFNHSALNGSLDGMDSMQEEIEASLWVKLFTTDSYNSEMNCQILDGSDGEIIQQVFYENFDAGVDTQLSYKHAADDYFQEKFKGLNIDNWSRLFQTKEGLVEKVKISISGNRKITMTKAERVAFILHSLNEGNMKHITTGGFAFVNTPSKIIKLNAEDVAVIVKSATPQEFKAAEIISEYLNTIQKDAINKTSVDLLGHDAATVENYFPIRTNFLDRFRDELIKAKGKNLAKITLEGMGIFKERQNASNALILEDVFSALYKSIDQVASYIGLASPMRTARALLNDNDFQMTMRDAGFKDKLDFYNMFLDRLEGNAVNIENVDRMTQELINRLDVSILGLNPFVMLKQPVSFTLAATEMDIKYLKEGAIGVASKELIAEIKKWSPQLRDRFDGNVTRELGELMQVGRVRKFFIHKEVISQHIMGGIRNFDMKAIAGIWRAVKLEIADTTDLKPGTNEFFEAVAARAWKVIRRTQPTFHIKDRSAIGMSRNVYIRLLTKYSSQRNKNWMILRRSFEEYNRSKKTNKDKAKLAKNLFILTVVAPLMIAGINELRNALYKREDAKSLFLRLTLGTVKNNLSSIYFVGDAFDSIQSKIEKGTYAGFDINNPVSSFVNEITDTVANGIRAITQSITQEKYKSGDFSGQLKWKKSLEKSFTGTLDAVGRLRGIPIASVRKLLTKPFAKKPQPKRKGIGG